MQTLANAIALASDSRRSVPAGFVAKRREFHGHGFLLELLSINRSDRPFQGADEQLLLDGGARCVRDLIRYSASGNQKDAETPGQILKDRDHIAILQLP